MKRKLYVLILALIIPCAMFLAACSEEDLKIPSLTSDMISLQYTNTTYDGTEKTPEVVVTLNNEVVSNSEYYVSYSNNTDAGTSTVTVTANAASEIIKGNAFVKFTISQVRSNASNFETLNSALSNNNFSTISLTEDVIIPAGSTLTVPQNKTLNCGNYIIINNGTIIKCWTINKRCLRRFFHYKW